jgi:gamma-glutamyl-gamma-aminobutyrate hydrolase PuuD
VTTTGVGRPVIAITTGEVTASWGPWRGRVHLVESAYVTAVAGGGGVPVVLPATDDGAAVLERFDGLLLTGGADVDPALYGAAPDPHTSKPDRRRDRFEQSLLATAAERGVPVLAICRGVQILNVWRGGSLHQHLPDVVGSDAHALEPGAYGTHHVRVAEGSRLERLLGRREDDAPGHHHQGVDRVGSGLVANAWADDGTIEGVEDPDADFLIGVQWHPEVGDDRRLFGRFVDACRPGG